MFCGSNKELENFHCVIGYKLTMVSTHCDYPVTVHLIFTIKKAAGNSKTVYFIKNPKNIIKRSGLGAKSLKKIASHPCKELNPQLRKPFEEPFLS